MRSVRDGRLLRGALVERAHLDENAYAEADCEADDPVSVGQLGALGADLLLELREDVGDWRRSERYRAEKDTASPTVGGLACPVSRLRVLS